MARPPTACTYQANESGASPSHRQRSCASLRVHHGVVCYACAAAAQLPQARSARLQLAQLFVACTCVHDQHTERRLLGMCARGKQVLDDRGTWEKLARQVLRRDASIRPWQCLRRAAACRVAHGVDPGDSNSRRRCVPVVGPKAVGFIAVGCNDVGCIVSYRCRDNDMIPATAYHNFFQ